MYNCLCYLHVKLILREYIYFTIIEKIELKRNLIENVIENVIEKN